MVAKMLSFSLMLCVSAFVGLTSGSAIPMWEYLKKEEKVSYLYSMFANQVEKFCETSDIPNCNQEFLKYGLHKLKDMSEDHLDNMDPYQRGANNIIWESMMSGHEMMKTTPKPQSTTTAKPNSYDDESFGDDFEFGAQGSASARIDNIYRVPPPKGFVFKAESGTPQYTYPHNFVPYLAQFDKTRSHNKIPQPTTFYPLTGPMVVRVYPNGTPVRETQQLPEDDDLRQYQWSKATLPNF